MRQRAWILVAIVVAIGGIAAATVGATSIAHRDADQSRENFHKSSREITSTLQLAIQHEQDLTASAGAYFSENPKSSSTEFKQWLRSMRAYARYPELQGIGASVVVRPSELAAFKKRAEADPPGPLSPGGKFEVIPGGKRPFYCLAQFGDSRPQAGGLQQPGAYDYCTGPTGGETADSKDSGDAIYVPLNLGPVQVLSTATPVYRSGGVPRTLKARL